MGDNFSWQQDLYSNWITLFSREYFLWHSQPTPYYRLDLSQLYTQPSTLSVTNDFIMIPSAAQANVYMQDFDPNNRIYIYTTINVAWEHRTKIQDEINEGINQWVEENKQIIHINDLTPQYGDLLYNPFETQWRYFMITNIEPWITETFFYVDLRRVNYNINIEPMSSNPQQFNNVTIPPETGTYVKVIANQGNLL